MTGTHHVRTATDRLAAQSEKGTKTVAVETAGVGSAVGGEVATVVGKIRGEWRGGELAAGEGDEDVPS